MRARLVVRMCLVMPALLTLPGRAARPADAAAEPPSGAASAALAAPAATQAEPARAAVERLVAVYVGLYTGATLERWGALFHPSALVASPDPGGSIRIRDLEAFLARQRGFFASGRRISERLENVRIEMGRRIARVAADFVFVDEGEEHRGKLGLHLVEERGDWKIVAVLFSYDAE